ncbi:MAG: glycosyltransferase family 2 protein [Anaerolineales bacterium]|nr:glycosyltransferase family 2 protein [Anaerolineales bacterium]
MNESHTTPRCSIVIRAFNEEQHLGRLLTGISHQTLTDYEVVLVDSGSTDATVAIARQYGARIIHIAPEEFTFGRSLNLGILAAQGEFIVIASAHVYPVYPDWLEKMLAPFEDPQVALTYGRQRGGPGSKFSEGQYFARWYPERSDLRQAHPFCNNANSAIRRELWQQQQYDETLTGLEDLAWAKWAMDQGRRIAYVAEAEIVHLHDESPRKVYNRFRREAMAFKRIYPEEKFSLWDFLRLTTSNIVSDIGHAARQKALAKNLLTILWFRTMQFAGTYRGYRSSGPVTGPLRRIFYYPRGLQADEAASEASSATRRAEPIRYQDPD